MSVLSDAQIASVARKAGFTGQGLAISIAVCLAESGGKTDAHNKNTNGSVDDGLWQINSVHRVAIAGRDLTNPDINASLAYQISSRGSNWKPWSSYNSGSYKKFMARAASASGQPNVDYAAGGTGTSAGTSGSTSDPTAFLSEFTNPGLWARVGVFIAAGLMLIIGLWQLTGIGGAVVTAARKALPV